LGDNTFNPTNRPELIVSSNVTAIAAGTQHSLFLMSDGSLWGMGYNRWGALGDGTTNNLNHPEQIVASKVTAIAAGFDHSLFLQRDGSLWAMGENSAGQLGNGIFNTSYPYGTNQPQLIVASNVTAISGGHHTLFLKSDGSLWAMGDNFYGQLGDGTFNNTNRPEQILAPYNRISAQFVGGGKVQLSFVGIAGGNYALDRSFTLAPPNWLP
jgi:alpha-tubulin suppressor-like RCC1 family protein